MTKKYPTPEQIYKVILACGKTARNTAPKVLVAPADDNRLNERLGAVAREGVEADDALLDRLARGAAQSLLGILPTTEDSDA